MRASFLVIKDTLIRLFIFGILLLTNYYTEMLLLTSFERRKIKLPTGTFSTIDRLLIYGISIFIYVTYSCWELSFPWAESWWHQCMGNRSSPPSMLPTFQDCWRKTCLLQNLLKGVKMTTYRYLFFWSIFIDSGSRSFFFLNSKPDSDPNFWWPKYF